MEEELVLAYSAIWDAKHAVPIGYWLPAIECMRLLYNN